VFREPLASKIEAVRKIWDSVQKQREPPEAIAIIEDNDAFVQSTSD